MGVWNMKSSKIFDRCALRSLSSAIDAFPVESGSTVGKTLLTMAIQEYIFDYPIEAQVLVYPIFCS